MTATTPSWRRVGAGEIQVGLVNHYYLMRQLIEQAPTSRLPTTSCPPAIRARW